MATNVRQVINTLGEALQWMAPYAGGSVPASTEPRYDEWVRWIQLGQEDAAKRGFWRRLLAPQTVTILADSEYFVLPINFHKVNGLYSLIVDGVDWADNANEVEQRLYIYMHPVEKRWVAKFMGFRPPAEVSATLWFFFNPPKPTQEDDVLFLDGEMCGYYALKEYFRRARQEGSLDDARIEYENRFQELMSLEAIPSRQELLSWGSSYNHLGQNPHERSYYSGRMGRRKWR